MVLKKIVFVVSLIFSGLLLSQTLSSQLDKDKIALGEVNQFKIRIDNLGGKDVQSAPKDELLPFHFEELNDSINKELNTYERTIQFAVYQEGKFTIPALEVLVGGQVYKTIPYELEVINTAQKGEKINDIMNNKTIDLQWGDYWNIYKFYVLAIIGFVVLSVFIFAFIKYFKKQKSTVVVTTNQTLKALEDLEKKAYIENNDYRPFYVELLDITRNFLTKQYGLPADVLLTDDLINEMKHHNNTISEENEAVIEEVMMRGDRVKFAKIFPDSNTMRQDIINIKAVVKRSVNDIEFENLRQDV